MSSTILLLLRLGLSTRVYNCPVCVCVFSFPRRIVVCCTRIHCRRAPRRTIRLPRWCWRAICRRREGKGGLLARASYDDDERETRKSLRSRDVSLTFHTFLHLLPVFFSVLFVCFFFCALQIALGKVSFTDKSPCLLLARFAHGDTHTHTMMLFNQPVGLTCTLPHPTTTTTLGTRLSSSLSLSTLILLYFLSLFQDSTTLSFFFFFMLLYRLFFFWSISGRRIYNWRRGVFSFDAYASYG